MTVTTMLMLTLILNGGEPTLAHPIISDVDADGTRQIAIPVRDVFEAAGYVVQFHGGEERRVEITGHAERLPERHLLRSGTLYFDRPELRSAEYVASLPFAVRAIDGTLYAPAIVMRIIAGGDLSADLDSATLRWDTRPPDDSPLLAIGELLSDLPRWLHRRVRVEGTFRGHDLPADRGASSAGAPAPGAWVVANDTGAIHCTDAVWTGRLLIMTPDVSAGEGAAVEGIVRPGWGGLPYLSGANAITEGAE